MATLFTNIKLLVNVRNTTSLLRGKELAYLPLIEEGFLIIEGALIAGFGKMSELKHKPSDFAFHVDATGKMIIPSWCDSHTHLVFAGTRESEFVDKINGLSYAEIAAKGGGILSTTKAVNALSEDELYKISYARLEEVARLGTGAIEIKSGYGLTVEGELKMLRVIKRLKASSKMLVKATFLGAHALPEEYKEARESYINLIIEKMLPAIAAEDLAQYIDVFCEKGFFTPEETEVICRAGAVYGLKPKIHANQLHISGGVQIAVALKALSADHLESMDEEAITALAHSSTIGTLLPTAAFFLRMPYQPARKIIDSGCAIALATDFNPGSSPSGNMNFVVALSCIQLRMLPEEAINSATINGAYAMEVHEEAGSITIGKRANLIMTREVPSLYFLPYSFGSNYIERVMLAGDWIT
jgi:imidazolonepropionase